MVLVNGIQNLRYGLIGISRPDLTPHYIGERIYLEESPYLSFVFSFCTLYFLHFGVQHLPHSFQQIVNRVITAVLTTQLNES